MTDEPGANEPGPNEPKVSALMRGEVERDDLDPATAAQLAAWFGAPATGVAASPEELAEEDSLRRERREVEKHLKAALDEKLAHKLESWTDSSGLTHLPPPMTLGIEREIARFDMGVWRVRSVDTRDIERPEDISDGLREAAPQAVLRDLHRPVITWPYLMLDQSVGVDVAGARSLEGIRETTGTSYRVHMERELIASQLMYREMSDLAALLDAPWEELEIPEEQRVTTSMGRTPEDILWFGAVGFDPTI